MNAFVRFSFDSGKAGVLTDTPVAIAAETVGITRPPIDCGTAIPLRAQTRQHRPNLSKKLVSMLLRSAAAKGICDLAACVINENARVPGLGARDVPRRLITAIGVSLPVAAERNPRSGVKLHVKLRIGPYREFLDCDHLELAESGLREIDRVLQDREWQCQHDVVRRYIGKLIADLKCEGVSAIRISAQGHKGLVRDDLRA